MTTFSEKSLSAGIKKKAGELGFNICGIAKSRPLEEYGSRLNSWIEAGMNDIMGYLARDMDKRLDPESMLPGAKSMIVTGLSYYSEKMQKDPEAPVLSRYTYGLDYHEVIRLKLEKLLDWIKSVRPEAEGKPFVDSSLILEKAWAREAGLGWQGRHSVVINKDIGSFFFIGILILDISLDYNAPLSKDYCGECRLCIEACPTGAINDNRTIDARKCIANITIERRGPIPEALVPFLGRRIYGCDRCQEVCPWNKKINSVKTPEFTLDEEIAAMSLNDWKNLSQEKFNRLFGKSAMSRIKYEKLMSNIEAATRQGN
ncbi:MAG: tRNA epoxyqueuosine(34) reductase QueG [Bacteroidota bacterium]|nr:tRNA epoxyqueuosine(34) reductase QueG [Bacteroidota bacterium]